MARTVKVTRPCSSTQFLDQMRGERNRIVDQCRRGWISPLSLRSSTRSAHALCYRVLRAFRQRYVVWQMVSFSHRSSCSSSTRLCGMLKRKNCITVSSAASCVVRCAAYAKRWNTFSVMVGPTMCLFLVLARRIYVRRKALSMLVFMPKHYADAAFVYNTQSICETTMRWSSTAGPLTE